MATCGLPMVVVGNDGKLSSIGSERDAGRHRKTMINVSSERFGMVEAQQRK